MNDKFSSFQNEEKEKRAAELIIANKELAFQNEEKDKRAAELNVANKELAFQNEEKEKRAAELNVANKELAFQNEEKDKRAAELIVANEELAFQNEEKDKRAAELIIANEELAFQNEEKEKRAAELNVANEELAFQNEEKEKRAAELIIANEELAFQNEEKEKRAAELSIANKELALQKEEVQHLATHDSLTGLPNRMLFTQLLNHSIQSAKRRKQCLAVFFIDLDRFKIINDTQGHSAGDQLLQEIALRYKQSLRAPDVVSRQGGDEFVILIEDFHHLSDLEIVATNILASTFKTIVLQGDEFRVTASIGISLYPKDGEDAQSLMKSADMAMYYAKDEGKNNFQFYSKDILSQSTGRWAIETNLRFALERNELSLHYQAKVDVKTGLITGVEALLRWNSTILGSVSPTQLIPVAEETGLIIPIGEWVLKTACCQNVEWQQQGLPDVCMAVNLSMRQLMEDNMLNEIKEALDESGLAPHLLELEITESMIMRSPKQVLSILNQIKSLGVRLAIDDFGTGYSSLAQLKNFPINTLKIDRSFVRNIQESNADKAITQAIIAMGETLGLTVVAEGVETVEQVTFLKEQSCNEIQGYFFSKPIEPELFADLLREQTKITLT